MAIEDVEVLVDELLYKGQIHGEDWSAYVHPDHADVIRISLEDAPLEILDEIEARGLLTRPLVCIADKAPRDELYLLRDGWYPNSVADLAPARFQWDGKDPTEVWWVPELARGDEYDDGYVKQSNYMVLSRIDSPGEGREWSHHGSRLMRELGGPHGAYAIAIRGDVHREDLLSLPERLADGPLDLEDVDARYDELMAEGLLEEIWPDFFDALNEWLMENLGGEIPQALLDDTRSPWHTEGRDLVESIFWDLGPEAYAEEGVHMTFRISNMDRLLEGMDDLLNRDDGDASGYRARLHDIISYGPED